MQNSSLRTALGSFVIGVMLLPMFLSFRAGRTRLGSSISRHWLAERLSRLTRFAGCSIFSGSMSADCTVAENRSGHSMLTSERRSRRRSRPMEKLVLAKGPTSARKPAPMRLKRVWHCFPGEGARLLRLVHFWASAFSKIGPGADRLETAHDKAFYWLPIRRDWLTRFDRS